MVINQNVTRQDMQTPQQGVGSPTGHTLNWECPTLLEATPGAPHRGCLARKVLMPQETSGSAKSSCGLSPTVSSFLGFFLDTGFPVFLAEVSWSFWLQAASLPEKQFGVNVLPFWETQPHTHRWCCSYLGRWNIQALCHGQAEPEHHVLVTFCGHQHL